MNAMISDFDAAAPHFERYRALPAGVPEAIRAAVFKATRKDPSARLLDLGAGTGRIGKVFVAASDFYVGVDLSLRMLKEFLPGAHGRPRLTQADGRRLPFRDSIFDVVMLMQVLGGTKDWRTLLGEVRRVLGPAGAVVVGQTVAPSDGVDARMKKRLAHILETMGVEAHRPGRSREQALAWLRSSAARHLHLRVAIWERYPTPGEFLVRHQSGARFSALPDAIKDEALRKLSAYAGETFGALDAAAPEEHGFELEVFLF